MKRWIKKIVSVAEKLDWSVDVDDDNKEVCIDFRKGSPAGEDFGFSGYGYDMEGMVANIEDYADCFDLDEHVKELLDAKAHGLAGVPSARELVEDADEIKDMLRELANALRNVA